MFFVTECRDLLVAPLICIREVPDSNLSPETSYPQSLQEYIFN
jgi:hypothetical protein